MISISHRTRYFTYCLIILAAFLTVACSASMASTPATILEAHYGGSGDLTGNSIWQTSDNGYIIAGTGPDPSNSNTNMILVKYDWSGNQVWTKNIGGSEGYSVRQTSDGGYIAAGNAADNLYLAKTDANGNKQWDKEFQGPDAGQVNGFSVQQTSDGGYIVVGEVEASSGEWNMYLIKTDASGNKQWIANYGPADSEVRTYSVWANSDGSYIVGGHIKAGYNEKPLLVKVDANGNVLWGKTYEGPGEYDNFASDMYSVQETRDGGYIYSGSNNRVMYLLKTDASGNKQWDNVYGPTDGVAGANSVQQTWDGGFIMAGFYPKPDGPNMMEVVRTDASGKELWENGYTGLGYAYGSSIIQVGNGTYAVTGWTKTDNNGVSNIDLTLIDKDMTPVPNAQVVSDSIPSRMEAGQSYTVSMTFLNNGTMPWTFQDKTLMGNTIGDAAKFGATVNQTVQIGTVVRPGQSYTFSETLKAPAENGTYNPQFRMVWLDHQMFGAPINKTVTVVNGTGPAAGTATVLPSAQATTTPTDSPASSLTASSIPVATQTQATATAKASPLPVWVPILAISMVALGMLASRKRGDQ